jgi:hypothetical protein
MGLLTALHLRRPHIWEPPTLLDSLLTSPLQLLASHIWHLLLSLRGRPFLPPRHQPPLRVVCISDTHDAVVPDVPDGDLLVHAGDLTNAGTVADLQRMLDWLAALPHEHKVFVCGNHDSWFDAKARKGADVQSGARPDLQGIHYLQDSAVTLRFRNGRTLHVYGAPDIPICGGPDNA